MIFTDKIKITKRERDVLALLAFHDKKIAERLGVSVTTVRTHILSLRIKYLAASKAQIIVAGLKRGDITVEEIEEVGK